MEFVMGIILIIAAVFLVVAVLLQSGKSHNLSGAIAGGAETFFGKTKGKSIDKVLSTATTVVAVIFVILVIFVYIFQTGESEDFFNENYDSITDTSAADDTAEADADVTEGETAADETVADDTVADDTVADETEAVAE